MKSFDPDQFMIDAATDDLRRLLHRYTRHNAPMRQGRRKDVVIVRMVELAPSFNPCQKHTRKTD